MTEQADLRADMAALEARARRAEMMVDLAAAALGAEDEGALLDVLLKAASDCTPPEENLNADLLYFGDDSTVAGWMEIVATWRRRGQPHNPVGTRFHASDAPFARLWINPSVDPLFVSDVETDDRLDASIRQMLRGYHIGALISIPLFYGGRRVGVFALRWEGPHVHCEDEQAVYGSLSRLLAPAIQNRSALWRLEKVARRQSGEVIRFRMMAERSPDAIMLMTAGGELIYTNPASRVLFGLPDRLDEQSFVALIAGEEAAAREVLRHWRETLVSSDSLVDLVTYCHRNGNCIVGQTIVVAIEDTANRSEVFAVIVRDVTVQMEIDREVQQSRQQFQDIFDRIPAAVHVKDPEGRLLFVNREWRERTGLLNREVLGRTTSELFSNLMPDSSPWDTGEKEVLETGRAMQFEDVSEFSGRHYLKVKSPLLDADGRPYAVCSTAIDITDRKQAEQEAHQTRLQLQTILDSTPAVFYAKDLEGRFIFVNQEWRIRTRLGEETPVIGRTRDELFPHLVPPGAIWTSHEEMVLGTGIPIQVEEVGNTTGFTYLATKFALRDSLGRIYAMCSTSIDITARKQAEKALRENEEKYRHLFEMESEALFLIESETGQILEANRAAIDMYGFNRSELLHLKNVDLSAEPERTRAGALEVSETPTLSPVTYHRKKGGQEFPVEIVAKAFVWRGRNVHIAAVRDITERMQAEEQVRRTRQQLQDMFDNTPAVVYTKDMQGRYLFVNRVWCERTGFTPEQVLGKSNAELYPPEIFSPQEIWDDHELEVVQSGQTMSFEEVGRITGRIYLSAKFLLRDSEGVPYALCSSSIDISERQEMERLAERTRRQIQDTFDNIPAVIYVKDMAGRYLLANEEFCCRAGITRDEVLGRTDREIFPQYEFLGGLWEESETTVLRTGEPLTLEEVGLRTGAVYLASKFLLYEADGTPYALCSCSFEITELRRVEAERERLLARVQEQASQVEQIVNSVPEGVILLDEQRTIVLANPAAREILRFLAGTGAEGPLTALGDRPLDELLTSPPEGLWHEITCAGPSPHTFEVVARPIEIGPQSLGWVLVLRDVTLEREIQRRVQQQERLAAVGQLAAGIAHDFNNIIAVIVLYAQILRQTADLPLRAQERLQTIAEQARRATTLIEQILDFSRRSIVERQPLLLIPFLKEQIKLLERTLPENISLHLRWEPGAYTISADPTRIQQVIMNLAVNARDAMPEGGALNIHLSQITVKAYDRPLPEIPEGEWICLRISDTGPGVPAEVLPHIFEPFFTTKRPGEGTGLGLAQVYGIVRQHDGYIEAASPAGQGVTFTIYLPLLDQVAYVPTEEGSTLIRGRGETILLVEDNTETRQALVATLEMLNYTVLTAVDGQQALAVWQGHSDQIALVLSDVVMPVMGGVALFHALKAGNPAVRFIFLTGHVLDEQLERQLSQLKAMGLHDWLQKPPDLEHLAQAIANALH